MTVLDSVPLASAPPFAPPFAPFKFGLVFAVFAAALVFAVFAVSALVFALVFARQSARRDNRAPRVYVRVYARAGKGGAAILIHMPRLTRISDCARIPPQAPRVRAGACPRGTIRVKRYRTIIYTI
eukprot:COSAG02_NODE_781_length_17261_cov_433.056054_15_plen_126_part_00